MLKFIDGVLIAKLVEWLLVDGRVLVNYLDVLTRLVVLLRFARDVLIR